jgi:transposase
MQAARKFVSPLKDKETSTLEVLLSQDPSRRVRIRAHSILLSARGSSIDEIASIYQVYRDTVSAWLDNWEASGVDGLRDRPRSGSPPKLNAQEQEVLKELIKMHPGSPRTVLAKLTEETGKTLSQPSLRRLSKAWGLRWKRVRKSVRSKRDEKAFKKAKKEIKGLKKTSRWRD